ncbi:MAG: acetyltransferase [Candidatus Omnitrophica bacterium]|nr:acetyltransferase [Candidatus Omnitrophota bacterium]
MKTKKRIILIGAGGHCKVIVDAIKLGKEFDIYGITDAKLPAKTKILGAPVLGKDEILPDIFRKGIKYAFISVGSVKDCSVRKAIDKELKKIGFKLAVIIHPGAIIAKDSEIGEGAFVAAGAVINPGSKIGRNAIINTSASIDHDCEIGDFVHVAPGATLSGGIKVGSETHIGTGANIIQYLKIGKQCLVKAGALLTSNLADGETWAKTDRKFEYENKPE